MKLNPQELDKIIALTLEYYNQRAEDFWKGPMRVIALIEDPVVVREILVPLGRWLYAASRQAQSGSELRQRAD